MRKSMNHKGAEKETITVDAKYQVPDLMKQHWNNSYASLKWADIPQPRIGSFLSLTHCYQMFRPTRYCKSPKQTQSWAQTSHCMKALDLLSWAAEFETLALSSRKKQKTPQGSLWLWHVYYCTTCKHVYTHIIRLDNKYNFKIILKSFFQTVLLEELEIKTR